MRSAQNIHVFTATKLCCNLFAEICTSQSRSEALMLLERGSSISAAANLLID